MKTIKRARTKRKLTENKAHSDTHTSSLYLQIENTTLDTPLADTIETLTDDHKHNEISVVLVDTRTPVIAKKQIEKIPMNHVNMIIQDIYIILSLEII